MAIGRPNWMRSLAYSAAARVHSAAMPTASADRISLDMSSIAWAPPASTVAGVSSRVIRAERRDGSRLTGVSTVTPGSLRSTTATSSPNATSNTLARPPPSTTPAEPEMVDPLSVAVAPRAPNATAAVRDPSARPGNRSAQAASSPMAAMAALAITVGTNGPGATLRASSSTTTTSSSRPKPEPP